MLVTIDQYTLNVKIFNHLVKTKQAFCFLENGQLITYDSLVEFFMNYKKIDLVEPANN